MNAVGNILWFIFGGFLSGLAWLCAGVIWCITIIGMIFFGIEMALGNFLIGLLWCVTIIGIPFGLQFFKIAKLSLMPFGAEVVRGY